ncbi:hypothetical protein OHA18_41360 [Kribbella sp. NBC_00709]|uniref:hypothetical protein n=1 Tax=Kribbella sp. NBC_00709 TaxID=2975972 RepID=UPI002E2CE897|nr:hypothetical protein [Kribbella sp. NBC_00709]
MPDDDKRAAYRALEDRVVLGEGMSSTQDRARAFANDGLSSPLADLIGKVADRPAQVTGHDLQAAKTSGLSEDEMFELVVCAAVGKSARLYDAGLAALVEAMGDRRPRDAS